MNTISKLKEKWGVGTVQFWLIILTFALGGSGSGRLTSFLMNLVVLEKNWAFGLIYPLILTILWPFSVLFVSIFTGQFRFFRSYMGRVASKIFGLTTGRTSSVESATQNAINAPIHIAIFASGTGSNARKIIEYFEGGAGQGVGAKSNALIKVSLIVCNVPGAGVLDIAKEKGIPTLLINKTEFEQTGYVESLENSDIHFIVLAGFLWKVPSVLVNAFKLGNKNAKGIINIHPALLPKYGGKGMYGARVHEAVIAAGEKTSGITIHWVNENYDEGEFIFQTKCSIENGDTPEMLANKIHALEHAHFAPTIEKLLTN
jgi:folate-dependent phosphoribosylglycinamide formyltransferase PurN